MSTKTTKQVAFIFDDLTEFYAARELIDTLKHEKISTDIIVPFDSGYNNLAHHTFQKIKDFGYSPLKDAPKNKLYKILFTPYPMINAIQRTDFIYHFRMPYSTISAKPYPTYNANYKIDYDVILCFNNYEPAFLDCYGAKCYAVPYWKYHNPKKISPTSTSQKPTLLILPTFGQDTSCVQYFTTSTINDIKKHFNIIIKAHHATHFNQDNKKAFTKLQNLADEFYDSDTPITDLIKKADLILSDNSGSIFEAIYSDTPVVTFSKNLNARHLDNIDTLQYQLMCHNILPHTNNPKEILSLLLSVESYFKKQQNIKKELFPKTDKNSIDITINIIKEYLKKDASKDYRKILHDAMVKEWYKNRNDVIALEKHIHFLESTINSLKSTIEEQSAILNSGAYKFYDKIITPYKKIKSIRSKNER